MRFYPSKKVFSLTRGFTLIELLISISIIGIISALVIVKFSAFDSTVLLKSAAYEVALALRDAQVYSVSVQGEGTNFDSPYGIHFVPETNSYTMFRYLNTDQTATPRYDTALPHNAQIKSTYVTGGSVRIEDVCVTTSSGESCKANGVGALDISFRRPEFNALFYSNGLSGINSVKIKVKSTKGDQVWVVEVGLLGHISVYKQ